MNIFDLLVEGGDTSPLNNDEDEQFGAGELTEALSGGNLRPLSDIETVSGGAKNSAVETTASPTPTVDLGSIDEQLTSDDLYSYILAEIKRKGIAGHHIESMNTFYKVGIKQIATKVFVVEGRLKNKRDKTDEDKEINEITFKIEFTDINLSPPTILKYKSGTPQMCTPNMARIKNLTYSAKMEIDASITATAFYKSGATKVRTAEFKNHRIANIPCQVRTELCNTYNVSKETLKELEEDPTDPGGYFIVNGSEWTIDCLENTANNTFHVHKNMYLNEIVRGNFLSKPGDAFENSYQIILRYLNNGAITMELNTTKSDKFEIPFYIVFRAMGMTGDKDIVDNIVYGVANEDATTKQLLQILEKAFSVEDPTFIGIRHSLDSNEIITYLAMKLSEGINVGAAKKDENVMKHINASMMNIFDRYLFPHIGTAVSDRIRKLRFLGHLINKLLCVNIGVLDSTDRDSYKGKRVHAAGTSMAKTFKTFFNIVVATECKNRLMRDFAAVPFSQVDLVDSVKSAINSDDLEKMLTQSITSGNKTITVRHNQISNRLSSQTVNHKNDLNVKSILNTINTPDTSASKSNDRADEMRRVHPTYAGYIDISQSADTGVKVGMQKQKACTASVSGATSSAVLKIKLLGDSQVMPLDNVSPAMISAEKLAKVFVNGDWIACCKSAHQLVHKYRMMRRNGEIHYLTTIAIEVLIREVYFWTDVGRMHRPLIIVYNNIQDFIDSRMRKDPNPVQFKQWINLTKKHIDSLRNGKVTMDDLRNDKIIEYISPEEQESTFIAANIDTLRQHQNNELYQYTHMDVDQAIFGVVSLAAPLANHSNAVRITMYTNHRKQSAAWFALNWPYRIDKNVSYQWYCERPLISAFSDAITNPNGHNAIVALTLYEGFGQEDSVVANEGSIACGMFNASFFNYERSELEKGEQFGNPEEARTLEIKREAIYEFTKDGFIKEGTLLKQGHVLIVKAAKIPKPIDNYLYVDKSILYSREEEARVSKVLITQNSEEAPLAKVQWRATRPVVVGDKFSSRTGNKGICARKVSRIDMPYCEDGLVPDLIVNPHSIPTRMAVNQIIECVLSQLAVRKGTYIDGTSFKKINIDDAVKELESYGIKYGGYRRMINGRTGKVFRSLIFIGPTTYQRLQKYVLDENYANQTGPTNVLTHQPLDGKINNGGLRLGEMEVWVLNSHGVINAMREKLYKDSDGATIYICRECSNRAIVNEKLGIYKCKFCGPNADISQVQSSRVANLFFSEASAMNVNMRFGLDPLKITMTEDQYLESL